MNSAENIPLEFRQQFELERARQTPGIIYGNGAIDVNGNITSAITNQGGNVTSVSQGSELFVSPNPPQKVVNQTTMIATDFASQYNGSSNLNRNYLLVQNKGATIMYVVLSGQQSASGTGGIKIAIGGSWEPVAVPVNSFSVTGEGVVVEGIAS